MAKMQFCIVYYTPPCKKGYREVVYTPDGCITKPLDYSKYPSYEGFPYYHWVKSSAEIISEDRKLWKSLDEYWEVQKKLVRIRYG